MAGRQGPRGSDNKVDGDGGDEGRVLVERRYTSCGDLVGTKSRYRLTVLCFSNSRHGV